MHLTKTQKVINALADIPVGGRFTTDEIKAKNPNLKVGAVMSRLIRGGYLQRIGPEKSREYRVVTSMKGMRARANKETFRAFREHIIKALRSRSTLSHADFSSIAKSVGIGSSPVTIRRQIDAMIENGDIIRLNRYTYAIGDAAKKEVFKEPAVTVNSGDDVNPVNANSVEAMSIEQQISLTASLLETLASRLREIGNGLSEAPAKSTGILIHEATREELIAEISNRIKNK